MSHVRSHIIEHKNFILSSINDTRSEIRVDLVGLFCLIFESNG